MKNYTNKLIVLLMGRDLIQYGTVLEHHPANNIVPEMVSIDWGNGEPTLVKASDIVVDTCGNLFCDLRKRSFGK